MTHSHDTSTPAMSDETVPSEEFVLVPREPTPEMLNAAPASYSPSFKTIWPLVCGDIYRAMIAAAPAPTEGPANAERFDYLSDAQARELFGTEDDDELPDGRVRVCAGEWVRIPGGYYFDGSAGLLHPETATPTEGPAVGSVAYFREALAGAKSALTAFTSQEPVEAVPVASHPASATDDRERLVEAQTLLRDIEWAGRRVKGWASCPDCRAVRMGGVGEHEPSCRIRAALSTEASR